MSATKSATMSGTHASPPAAYRLVALYGWDDLVFTHILLVCRDRSTTS